MDGSVRSSPNDDSNFDFTFEGQWMAEDLARFESAIARLEIDRAGVDRTGTKPRAVSVGLGTAYRMIHTEGETIALTLSAGASRIEWTAFLSTGLYHRPKRSFGEWRPGAVRAYASTGCSTLLRGYYGPVD